MIVYISIGNSDDKLTQVQWNDFCTEMDYVLDQAPRHAHGKWFSEPRSIYQNACWCIDMPDSEVGTQELVERLRRLAKKYRQDSIAWAEVAQTIFIEGEAA